MQSNAEVETLTTVMAARLGYDVAEHLFNAEALTQCCCSVIPASPLESSLSQMFAFPVRA